MSQTMKQMFETYGVEPRAAVLTRDQQQMLIEAIISDAAKIHKNAVRLEMHTVGLGGELPRSMMYAMQQLRFAVLNARNELFIMTRHNLPEDRVVSGDPNGEVTHELLTHAQT